MLALPERVHSNTLRSPLREATDSAQMAASGARHLGLPGAGRLALRGEAYRAVGSAASAVTSLQQGDDRGAALHGVRSVSAGGAMMGLLSRVAWVAGRPWQRCYGLWPGLCYAIQRHQEEQLLSRLGVLRGT